MTTVRRESSIVNADGEIAFIVEARFLITKVGMMLTPGVGSVYVKIGDKIKLIRPDKTAVESKICGLTFEHHTIAVAGIFNKNEVPIGTEVWLVNE